MAATMSVILIDDHQLFREGLRGLLERRGIQVLSCASAKEGIPLVQQQKPEVVLLDLRMPDVDGSRALKQMRNDGIDTPVAVLTTSTDSRDLAECLQNGANGYLLKDMEPDALVAALRKIVIGEIVVAPELAAVLATIVQNGSREKDFQSDSVFDALTPRELEILCHLSEGQSNKSIARHLDISDGTVKLHVKSILRKLEIHSRVEAAVMAVEAGICNRSR